MKRFRFSLSAVQDVRAAEEQSAQKVFADAVRACEEAAVRLMALDRDLQNVWDGMRNSAVQGMRADQMRHAHSWCLVLEDTQKQLAKELSEHQRHVDVAHAALQQATRRREVLDRIFRKHRRAHEYAAQAEDQKFLDEIATRGAWHGVPQLEAA
ncbi:MAG TPA: flagellar export protein FliJ [Candidatus Acidoferrum sp.]|nr:flagellar export protein FliJ [Candidatus Acidoferrum sp.]